nr:DEAD/DEAH box helicase [Bacteroidota bacterium]
MTTDVIKSIKETLKSIQPGEGSGNLVYRQGHSLYLNGQCSILSETENHFKLVVDDKHDDFHVDLDFSGDINTICSCNSGSLCRHKVASLLQLHENITLTHDNIPETGLKYTQKGMMQRVIGERKDKARDARYTVEFSDNIFGEHILTNERGIQYKLTFRDIHRKHGYCSCPDYRTNKLGICKHLIFAFEGLLSKGELPEKFPEYPFIEVFLNPFRNYKISWFYPGKPVGEVAEILYRYFGNKNFVEDNEIERMLGFFERSKNFKQILIRPEVYEKIEKWYEKAALQRLKKEKAIDFSSLKENLFPYQEDGVRFLTFKKGTLLADEMGLGKTAQAIVAALMKKQIFGFTRTLVICPASLKFQWRSEIEKFTHEEVVIVEGKQHEREQTYKNSTAHFFIINYETFIRDIENILNHPPDLLILDEAQRINNYETITASSIRSIPRKHTIAITSMPFDSQFVDLYSIMLFVDQDMLTPLWEFSYQHCYFDKNQKNKIVGYFNMQDIAKKLQSVMIRREKQDVVDQLPHISHLNIPVKLHPLQAKQHMAMAGEIVGILDKSPLTAYDFQRISFLIGKMRMLSNASFLVDDTNDVSPKVDELQHILLNKMNMNGNTHKILIITEWKKMMHIIARMLRRIRVDFVMFTGDTPIKKREEIVNKFSKDDNCNVFLTSEISEGLNLQAADTMINFEVPLNALQMKRRISRIDRIGQRAANLTVINLIAEHSVEEIILSEEFQESKIADFSQGDEHPEQNQMLSEAYRIKFRSDLMKSLEELKTLKQHQKEKVPGKTSQQIMIDFGEEEEEPVEMPSKTTGELAGEIKSYQTEDLLAKEGDSTANMEELLKSGMGFLSNLYKVATGKEISISSHLANIDPETKEVTLKFRVGE